MVARGSEAHKFTGDTVGDALRFGANPPIPHGKATGIRRRAQAVSTAASAFSTWPATRTLRQIWRTRPSSPSRKVLRIMPWLTRPYIRFSPQAP